MSEDIYAFFVLLEQNERVHSRALQSLKLQRDLRKAVRILEPITDVRRLSARVQESWSLMLKVIEGLRKFGVGSASGSNVSSKPSSASLGWPEVMEQFSKAAEQESKAIMELLSKAGVGFFRP